MRGFLTFTDVLKNEKRMRIKLVITDIDGVWTDGSVYLDDQGNETKRFSTSDGIAVGTLAAANIPLAIISGEGGATATLRAKELKVPYVFLGVDNKLLAAVELCESLGISLEEVAFIGDEINDILLLERAGISAVPANVPYYVRRAAKWELSKKGGEGVFREFVDRIFQEEEVLEYVLEAYLHPMRKIFNER